jgi:hypothetical protein
VFVTDGRFLSAGSNQLHQDLVAVDEHRPNLKQQEVGGLDVRNLFNLIHSKEQV